MHIVENLVSRTAVPDLRHGPVPCRACVIDFDAKVQWLRNNRAFLDSDTPIPPDAHPADRDRQVG